MPKVLSLLSKTAEAVGKGRELAMIMLDAAASFLADKIKREKRQDLFVTLNVSFGQMREKGFAAAVEETIKRFALPANSLVLELTEGDAVADHPMSAALFAEFKKAGAALAFDDFGAGFSCLSNLQKYDFDYIKIDKSFVDGLESDGDSAKIVRSLAGLGKDLGLKVIAEGIETKAAATAARKIGCIYGQGYVFGKPLESGQSDVAPSADAPSEIALSPEDKEEEPQKAAAEEPKEEKKASLTELTSLSKKPIPSYAMTSVVPKTASLARAKTASKPDEMVLSEADKVSPAVDPVTAEQNLKAKSGARWTRWRRLR